MCIYKKTTSTFSFDFAALTAFSKRNDKKNLTDPDVFGTENIMNKVSNGVRDKELSILI